MGRSLTAAAIVALVAGCSGFEPGEPWDRDEIADTDDAPVSVFAIEPLGDDPADDDDAQTPWQPSPRGCEPENWSSDWTPVTDDPVLQAHVAWESVGLRPSQIIEDQGQRQAWYVGQSLEHCSVGGWAATCLVGRVGRASAPEAGDDVWAFYDDWPSMDLWHWGLSVRRLFVTPPEASSAGRWDAWLAIEGVDVDSKIYWATSDDGDRWTVRVSEPALGPGYDSWDAAGVSDPAVWTRGGITTMLYTGFSGDFDRPQIGLAQLTDQGWVRADADPVLAHGKPNRHDSWGVLRPSVLVFDDCLVAFHQAIDDDGNSTLSVATSSDGRTWSRSDHPLQTSSGLPSWHDAGEYDPVAYVDGDEVYLLYNGASRTDTGGVGWLTLP